MVYSKRFHGFYVEKILWIACRPKDKVNVFSLDLYVDQVY